MTSSWVASLCGLLVLSVACRPDLPALPTVDGPSKAVALGRVSLQLGKGAARDRWALKGQWVPVSEAGEVGLPVAAGARWHVFQTGRELRLNDGVVGIDISELAPGEAARLILKQRKGLRVVLWREVRTLEPAVLGALAKAGSQPLTVIIEQALAAPPLDLSGLVSLGTRLRALVLRAELRGPELEALARLPGLQVLQIRGSLQPAGVRALGRLTGLRQLILRGSLRVFSVDGEALYPLARLRRLEVLDLGDNGLSDGALPALRALTALRWLDLAGNRLTGTGLGQLRALGRLAWFDLTDNPVKGRRLGALQGLKQLQVLNLSGTAAGNAGVARVAGLPRLRWLGLRKAGVSARGVVAFRRARPNCQVDWTGRMPRTAVRPGPPGRPGQRAVKVPGCARMLRVMLCAARISPPRTRASRMSQYRRFSARLERVLGRTGMTASLRTALSRVCKRRLEQLRRQIRGQAGGRRCLRP